MTLETFIHTHPEWGTPDGALGQCRVALQDFLVAFPDAVARHLVCTSWIADTSRAHPYLWRAQKKILPCRLWTHHISLLDESTVLDLTARQFDRDASYPLLYPVSDIGLYWKTHHSID